MPPTLPTICLAGLLAAASVSADTRLDIVARPDPTPTSAHYITNRPPLKPTALIKLPVGDVTPGGWLAEMMQRQRDGLTGHLNEISAWVQKEDNAWLDPRGEGEWGWEELPYWLKGYGNLAYILNDEAMLAETRTWIEGAFASRREDGNFGPVRRFEDDGSQDFWANMIMLFCLQSYYEHSGDERVLEHLNDYFRYQLSVPDEMFLTHYWQRMRGGDNLHSVFWLYNRTGEKWLLELAEKVHRNTADWAMPGDLPNRHNVNVAQGFREPAQYWQLSHKPAHLQAAYDNHHLIRAEYGQVPGGMFGGDEICRPGFDDPRQAIETCGIVEQMYSDELLLRLTGDTFWADHCELIAFNALPAAFMPDMRSLRYLSSPNMAVSDAENHAPGIYNGGPFLVMNPLSSRCCQHNHAQGWPYFCESLWAATPDGGACAALYAPCEATIRVGEGEGTLVAIVQETRYPFEETIDLTLQPQRAVTFPLYLRVPAWCTEASAQVNGETLRISGAAGRFIRLEREWSDGDRVRLRFPMQVRLTRWERNHDSLSIDYGPLTFSLHIKETYRQVDSTTTALDGAKWQTNLDVNDWPSYEILPGSAWNYGLVLDEQAAVESFAVRRRAWPIDDFPFTPAAAPITIAARGRRIPHWKLDQHGLCAPLQHSPVRSSEPVEKLQLIPMGAARLRITAFPVIGARPEAHDWQPPTLPKRLYAARASHCYGGDSTQAVADDLVPETSNDQAIPRHTFWPHKGGDEWLEARFPAPRRVSAVSVYWFDDRSTGGECAVPAAWRLLYEDAQGTWKHVETRDELGVARDQFNRATFESVEAQALRLEVTLQRQFSAGVLEWRIE